MITVPSDIMSRFQIFLDRKPVPKQFQAHYKKWFRYYWDFCHKYDPIFKPESLHLFLDKLRQKKQTEFQIQQASDAIALYYEMVKENIPFFCPQENTEEDNLRCKKTFYGIRSKVPECRSRQFIGVFTTIPAPLHDCQCILREPEDSQGAAGNGSKS